MAKKTLHDQMREKAELAFVYAEDGALSSAARIFKEIANAYAARHRELEEFRKMARE